MEKRFSDKECFECPKRTECMAIATTCSEEREKHEECPVAEQCHSRKVECKIFARKLFDLGTESVPEEVLAMAILAVLLSSTPVILKEED